MIGHRGEVKGMGVVVRVFLLSNLFWLTLGLTLGFWLRLGFDSGRPGAGCSFLLCFLREGYADAEACCKVEFGFGLCILKMGIVLFVHVPRRLPSVPSNRSCYGYSSVNIMYLFICKSHITCLVSE